MGQALYRKYRSKSLAEIVGQEHVTSTLTNALKQGRTSHAYLLSGPRGTGKTSIARILAHELNDLPYGDEAHLDIIEIDAASNRRIDEIRDLRDRVNTAPARAKYKVYIIDEVHMLTKEAFNALLKTLEEPPAHVVFILATTEAHKLPETILSRVQRYNLRPVPLDQVTTHLRHIADGEKVVIDDDALQLIAEHGEGSFRDSISLLDQASSTSEQVTRADVERILGLAPTEYITRTSDAVGNGDKTAVVTTLGELYGLGYEPAMIAQQLSAAIRSQILEGSSASPQAHLHLLAALLDVPSARNPRQLLEITLLQAALPADTPAAPTQPAPQPIVKPIASAPAPSQPAAAPAPAPTPTPTLPAPAEVPTTVEAPATKPADPAPEPIAAAPIEPIDTKDATELWHQALEAVKKQYNTLYGIARMAHPVLDADGQRLMLHFKFAFHQKRVNEAKNRKIFGDIIEKLCGHPVEITCIVDEAGATAGAGKPDVAAISNIFGGAELLES